ncbi:uncharacterized protein LOC130014957 [Mercurialis annua]|uniref:uncharacterized protein LOC130014957 n=1 Tax=Mercurialis annua TaxID=3986 RepID=UPI0024AFED3E|nr:uncharacterized protein LOC130014957 [Mercurialis annua]
MENESRDRGNEDDNAEISLKPRSLPPAHYIFKIKNFSLLSNAKVDSFQSAHFDVGGYTWKLSVYPRGNKKRNGEGYISLYLVLTKSNKLAFNQEVNVSFKLFVYDFVHDEYLTVQDASYAQFKSSQKTMGFPDFMPLIDLNDISKGFISSNTLVVELEIQAMTEWNSFQCNVNKAKLAALIFGAINQLEGIYSFQIRAAHQIVSRATLLHRFPAIWQGILTSFNAGSTTSIKAGQKISWKLRSLPPAHYSFKIENFSLLSDAKAEFFHSADFEAGSYNWLVSASFIFQASLFSPNPTKAVNVTFKLFVYDYICDKYCNVQDEKVRRFCGIRREWGFDKLVSLTDFKDKSNGYLMEDCCIFGAEIFVIENGSKEECFSMLKTPANNTYTWTIENFSELNLLEFTNSKVFAIGGSIWSLDLYPKGDSRAKGKSLAMFLKLEDHARFEHGRKLYAEFPLRVLIISSILMSRHGVLQNLSLVNLNDEKKGFLHYFGG